MKWLCFSHWKAEVFDSIRLGGWTAQINIKENNSKNLYNNHFVFVFSKEIKLKKLVDLVERQQLSDSGQYVSHLWESLALFIWEAWLTNEPAFPFTLTSNRVTICVFQAIIKLTALLDKY